MKIAARPQLTSAANIPFPELVEYSFPVIEAVLGIMLLVGLHARISALIASISMVVAICVHVVVDLSLFPLQPVEARELGVSTFD